MALFDIFRRKKAEPAPVAEEQQSAQIEEQKSVHTEEQQSAHTEEHTSSQAEVQATSSQAEVTEGLKKTKEGFFGKLARAVAGRSQVDADVLDDLEEVLITSDVGVETTVKIIENIERRVAKDKYNLCRKEENVIHYSNK
jgi:signal recognition particle GTPase